MTFEEPKLFCGKTILVAESIPRHNMNKDKHHINMFYWFNHKLDLA